MVLNASYGDHHVHNNGRLGWRRLPSASVEQVLAGNSVESCRTLTGRAAKQQGEEFVVAKTMMDTSAQLYALEQRLREVEHSLCQVTGESPFWHVPW